MRNFKHLFCMIFFITIFIIIITFVFKYKVNERNNVVKVFNKELESSKYSIFEIVEETKNYSIKVYTPNTKYEILDDEINKKISKDIEKFKDNIKGIDINEEKNGNVSSKYIFDVTFSTYEYDNFISVKLDETYYTGGAHPNENIITFCYNIKKNKIITLDDIIKQNSEFLSAISKICYDALVKNERIKEYGNKSMLMYGTSMKESNFKNFVLKKDCITFYFNKYQVAPYVAGSFTVDILYDDLKIKF